MSLFIQTCGARSFKNREELNASSSPRSPRSPGKSGWRRARMMMSCTSAQQSEEEDEPSVLGQTVCAICLETLKAGQGHALFTSECSHTFHFQCIAANAQHGNLICPVCRAKWKQVPWRAPSDLSALDAVCQASDSSNSNHARIQRLAPVSRGNLRLQRSNSWLELISDAAAADGAAAAAASQPQILNNSTHPARAGRAPPRFQEFNMFDDDEPLVTTSNVVTGTDSQVEGEIALRIPSGGLQEEISSSHAQSETRTTEQEVHSTSSEISLNGYPEVDEVAAGEITEAFTVLVNVKAGLHNRNTPPANGSDGSQPPQAREHEADSELLELDPNNRAPLDLVTVLDISSSMSGTKLKLLKCAMEFVIHNLSPSDRLSVVAFSSSARRLFSLRRMVEDGRQFALRYVNSLEADGGTNIADGLRKGAKVLVDRRMRNPVASIMLLSDGQDSYNMRSYRSYDQFIPSSPRSEQGSHDRIPVHTFGFGADHDAALMHSISEASGGTFSFIQTEDAVQDAFAQCIGGLLSVIVQNAQIKIVAGEQGVEIKSIQAGNYETSISDNRSEGVVKIGDLYADEERDILVDVKLPAAPVPAKDLSTDGSGSLVTKILRVSCSFQHPLTHDVNGNSSVIDINIRRPEFVDTGAGTVRLEVDRERNRTRVAQSIVEARALAEAGDIAGAQLILSSAKESLLRSRAFQAQDQLCLGLERELVEIQSRMQNRQTYHRSGRAYSYSVTSSHLQQRSTTRGHSANDDADQYRTPSMVFMVNRSQSLSATGLNAPTGPVQDSRGGRSTQRLTQRSVYLPRMPEAGESEGAQDSGGHQQVSDGTSAVSPRSLVPQADPV